MTDESARLLAAYDAELRGLAEVCTAPSWDRVGPLWRATYEDRGQVTYESLAGYDLPRLVAATVEHYRDQGVGSFEWKTRDHDDLPELDGVLRAAGFVPEEVETVMVGEADALAVDVPLPPGGRVRRVDDDGDATSALAGASEVQRQAFGRVGDLAAHVERGGGDVEVWIAEVDDRMVAVGRLDVVPGTRFAGLWGGATVPAWRGRGFYRALTAARARSALARGHDLLQSDCTAMSRPILQRAGLVAVTTTTPYVWTRSESG